MKFPYDHSSLQMRNKDASQCGDTYPLKMAYMQSRVSGNAAGSVGVATLKMVPRRRNITANDITDCCVWRSEAASRTHALSTKPCARRIEISTSLAYGEEDAYADPKRVQENQTLNRYYRSDRDLWEEFDVRQLRLEDEFLRDFRKRVNQRFWLQAKLWQVAVMKDILEHETDMVICKNIDMYRRGRARRGYSRY